MSVPPKVEEALREFEKIYLNGIPFLLEQNDTAFLSFLCVMCATDALAGYRYQNLKDPERFKKFVADYFPAAYSTHAEKLWLFRCRMLHNFSPAYFSLVHGSPESHLQVNPKIGDHFLSDVVLFADLKTATKKKIFGTAFQHRASAWHAFSTRESGWRRCDL